MIAERRTDGLAVDDESVRRAIENCERPDYRCPGELLTPEEQADSAASDDSLASRAYMLATNAGAAVGM
ncbi:MAG: hypothetical protein M3071_14760 [Actinomycetota bacterium]|nr:hypothetical protein [Actinomycetota bacterium]